MTMPQDEKREERALDALIVAALRADLGEIPPSPDQGYPDLMDEDRQALEALGPDFIKRLLAGQQDLNRSTKREPAARELASAMNRGDDEIDLTDKAREEIERRIRESEEQEEPDRGDDAQ